MGASNRTLLSKLGFADADRKNSRHDLACAYIGQNESVLRTVLQAALPPQLLCLSATGSPEHHVTKGDGKYSTTVGFVDVLATFTVGIPVLLRDPVPLPGESPDERRLSAELFRLDRQHPVYGRPDWMASASKDETDGYFGWRSATRADLAKKLGITLGDEDRRYREQCQSSPKSEVLAVKEFLAVVEVKITPCSSGDLIRQLRVYNEHIEYVGKRTLEPVPSKSWADYIASNSRKMLEDQEKRYFLDHTERAAGRPGLVPRCTVAALDFDIDSEYRGALKAAGVTPVRLGAGFERWLEGRKQSGAQEELPEV